MSQAFADSMIEFIGQARHASVNRCSCWSDRAVILRWTLIACLIPSRLHRCHQEESLVM